MRGMVRLGDDRVGDRPFAALRKQGINSGGQWGSRLDGLV